MCICNDIGSPEQSQFRAVSFHIQSLSILWRIIKDLTPWVSSQDLPRLDQDPQATDQEPMKGHREKQACSLTFWAGIGISVFPIFSQNGWEVLAAQG